MFNLKAMLDKRLSKSVVYFWLNELRHNLITRPRAAYQRARYGWAKWDIIGPGFDLTFVPAIGHSLITLAEVAHGYPSGYGQDNYDGADSHIVAGEYYDDEKSFDLWRMDLLRHGNALLNYGDGMGDVDRAKEKAVTEALHWVSDYWGSLWD